ncbi:MAG: hypothetical protein QOH06_1033 [Acidobacteriota bacterium]|jgi:hypothetical protein|nr:hypothetical protein [Acidobacteriota bacterium]
MGWERRNRRHPPVGQDKPEAYRVVVYDTFFQHMFRNAARVIRNGSDVPEFLMFCASYVLTRHRSLTHLRKIYRKGKRDIQAAVDTVPGSKLDPYPELESRQRREREHAFDRFARWAERELHEDITGEKR